MRKTTYILVGVLIFLAGLAVAVPGKVSAIIDTVAQSEQVCEGLDSGKIDVSGDQKSITITAPDGFLIDRYCVKAGSANQGDGPVYVDVNPPQKTVTITHPSGKDISHYSYSLVPITDTTTTDTTTTTTTTTTGTTETTTTSTTPTTPAVTTPTTPAPTTPAPPTPTTPTPTPTPTSEATTPEATTPDQPSAQPKPDKPRQVPKPDRPRSTPGTTPTSEEELPFTGFPLLAIALLGVGMVAGGLGLRKL